MKTKKKYKNTALPTFKEEKKLWKKGIKYIAGVDEVGRGSLACPLLAAAVIFPANFKPDFEINDSKKISIKKRKEIEPKIKKCALSIGIGIASVSYINRHGIVKATQRAFLNAIKNLHIKPEYILVDAFYINSLDKSIQKPIIHGDSLSISIAAASIIAKVKRDNILINLHSKYKQFGFLTNKGYGTKYHLETIKKQGICKHHRTIFNLFK